MDAAVDAVCRIAATAPGYLLHPADAARLEKAAKQIRRKTKKAHHTP